MEIVYFIGAFIVLIAMIYGTYHYRDRSKSWDRSKSKVAEQIVRDRDHPNET